MLIGYQVNSLMQIALNTVPSRSFSGEIGIKGGHMLECPYTSTVFRQRLTRQWLTHFLKIPKIFKIQKFFGELCQNPLFLVKIIFGVTLILLQSKICTPKIDTPKIYAFLKFWALLKCVNLWRRTVNNRVSKLIMFPSYVFK